VDFVAERGICLI